ncbi:relaxase/mobilization nuclease domain-containing protein [Flavobacterium sp. 245]|uniref:relaxase/mobilization nuclease domain-containing protein n=1 Tax=Flavobacterium sp. 245 TaxID=2512115 RepID=UPI00105C2F24|nr:relaxase/mobilization nuclease domain-containing protein [Flavobacterium sp. 245]TDO96113.1 relaxase/mobilization nuclease-like protein [Flavobacterium sp. 245]
MVAIIKTSHSIHNILNYNENKVKTGVAECISAENYPLELEKLSFNLKLNRFLKLASLNENAKRNSVHISLNFDPSENHSKEKLIEIANMYMEKIGFGKQPYLIYQHHDAGHPHLHLVTNNIQRDGKRIDLHLLGIRKSEPARKEIEELFGLVKADGKKNKQDISIQQASARIVNYGKVESKKAINGVLNMVLNQYKYSSLPELNAILKQCNIMADRGKEDSKIFQTRGLVYRILDQEGNPIGVPIKASSFYNKPTLKFLEEKFKTSEIRNATDKTRVKNAIDLALIKENNFSLNDLAKQLEKEGINTVFRKSEKGLLYGITYVDHTTKNVFNGSSLGKQYSAKAIEYRCSSTFTNESKRESQTDKLEIKNKFQDEKQKLQTFSKMENVVNSLLQSEQLKEFLPYQLKKKKKKRGLNLR